VKKKFRIIKYKPNIKPALKLKNISKAFEGRPILQDLHLSLQPGSINGLLGENGSGKTTLFSLIVGTLKADSGEIFAKGGALISNLPIHERCRKFRISYVPQKLSLLSGLSCQDNIRGLCQITMNDNRKIDEICDRLLTEFSLLDVAKVRASELSGGQAKRLSIARALINDPDIILFDEIFAALSPKIVETLKKLIMNLQTSRKSLTILISDHIYNHILDLADSVHILSEGHIIKSDLPANIIKDPSSIKAYFGSSS
jgi:lipopolysaccharide export system ATP-binding protein